MTTCEYSQKETNYGEFEQRWIYSYSSDLAKKRKKSANVWTILSKRKQCG